MISYVGRQVAGNAIPATTLASFLEAVGADGVADRGAEVVDLDDVSAKAEHLPVGQLNVEHPSAGEVPRPVEVAVPGLVGQPVLDEAVLGVVPQRLQLPIAGPEWRVDGDDHGAGDQPIQGVERVVLVPSVPPTAMASIKPPPAKTAIRSKTSRSSSSSIE